MFLSDSRRGMAEWVQMVCNLAPSWSVSYAQMPVPTGSWRGLGRRAPYFTCCVGATNRPRRDTVSPFPPIPLCASPSSPTLPSMNHHECKHHQTGNGEINNAAYVNNNKYELEFRTVPLVHFSVFLHARGRHNSASSQ